MTKESRMAQTTAQRQAAYRARRATAGKDGNGERRLDMWVSSEVDLALARLARRYAVTKRQMLERLIVRADDAIVRRLDPDSDLRPPCFFSICAAKCLPLISINEPVNEELTLKRCSKDTQTTSCEFVAQRSEGCSPVLCSGAPSGTSTALNIR
jgi:hypothetical protein